MPSLADVADKLKADLDPAAPRERRAERIRNETQEGIMRVPVEELKRQMANNGCVAGEQCAGMGFMKFEDLPQQHPAAGRVFTCGCIATQMEARRLASMFEDADVPERYHNLGFATFEALSDGQLQGKREALKLCRQFANAQLFDHDGGIVADDGVKRGLLLYGPVGRGKSGLSVAIFRAWSEAKRTGLWIAWIDFLEKIKETYHTEANTRDVVRAAQNVQLLIVDEFGDVARGASGGNFAVTDHAREKAWEVIGHRHARNAPTVITSNLSPARIYEQFGAMMGDRIRELCHAAEVGGVNLRA
jgi:DNA replication protein DnaC